MIVMEHDIESESLPAHVSICQERYRALEHKFEEVDRKIDSINTVLVSIRDDITKITADNHNRWSSAQIAVIGLLMSIIGALIGHIIG